VFFSELQWKIKEAKIGYDVLDSLDNVLGTILTREDGIYCYYRDNHRSDIMIFSFTIKHIRDYQRDLNTSCGGE